MLDVSNKSTVASEESNKHNNIKSTTRCTTGWQGIGKAITAQLADRRSNCYTNDMEYLPGVGAIIFPIARYKMPRFQSNPSGFLCSSDLFVERVVPC